jgi:hypothetical protein
MEFCQWRGPAPRLRDGFAFMLGNGREDVDGQRVRLGHIDGDEIDTALPSSTLS